MRRVNITVDKDWKFFKESEISEDEVDFLFRKGYTRSLQFDIFGGKSYYLLKPDKNEGCEHFFLMRTISKYTQEILGLPTWNYKTVKPDIIIEFKNRKVAIEIETGKVLRNNKKQFIEKVNRLDKDFGDNWFFVVTNRNLVKKYKKYGPTYTRKNVIKAIEKYVKKAERINMSKRVVYY